MDKRAVAVIIKDGKILLMRRIRGGEEYFVFPGGGVGEGENPEDAVIREIKEEFCIDIKVDKLLFEIENKGRREFYYLVNEFSSISKIGGEEKERMNENNQYYPVWKELSEILDLSNLYPESAKQKVVETILQ